jgi:hypothetical protein
LILLHLFDLVFDNDSLLDHLVEILIVGIEKLEPNLVVEPIQEDILFLFICIHNIRCIPWHLGEFVEVLLQFGELLFQFERTTRYIVSSKLSFELIPGDSTNILVRVVVCFPPFSSGAK